MLDPADGRGKDIRLPRVCGDGLSRLQPPRYLELKEKMHMMETSCSFCNGRIRHVYNENLARLEIFLHKMVDKEVAS